MSTIQDFNSETEDHHLDRSEIIIISMLSTFAFPYRYKNVVINNCSAPHYTVLLQLGEEGVHMNNFTFMNFVSLKLIIEGEIKENVSIDISNFKGVFGNVLGKTCFSIKCH